MPRLCLTRKAGESILIGSDVVLTVVSIDRNRVHLCVEAPADVKVYREEIAPSVIPDRGPPKPAA